MNRTEKGWGKKRNKTKRGTEQFVKTSQEPSVCRYDRGMSRTIARIFYSFVIGRVSARPGISGMQIPHGSGGIRQLVAGSHQAKASPNTSTCF